MKFYMLWVKEPFSDYNCDIRPFALTQTLERFVEFGEDDKGDIANYIFFKREEAEEAYSSLIRFNGDTYFIMEFEL